MSARRIEVEIGQLVLHGFPPLDRHAVAEALQRELAERIAAQPPSGLVSAEALDAGRFDAPPGGGAGALGTGVAQRLGKALG